MNTFGVGRRFLMGRSYDLRELEISRNPDHVNHQQPALDRYTSVLDIGCGMGQTLIASEIPTDRRAWGVDANPEAIARGREIAPSNVHLVHAPAEALPFPDASFDLVFSRVAIVYTYLNRSLPEAYRVLQPAGDLWLLLHSFRTLRRLTREAINKADWSEALYFGLVYCNSLLFGSFGIQCTRETVHTERSIRRALAKAGFQSITSRDEKFFVVQAKKPAS